MEITAITPQKKDKTRCNIEVDGRFFCGMKLETVVENRLKVGSEVTEEFLSRIQLESEKRTALDKALSHISLSMKTEREVRAFLAKKGYLPDVADYTVEKMRGYGFLDDGAYAASYAESASKRKGKRLIEAELRQKGVPDEAIRSALEGLGDETEQAKRTLEKYLRGKDGSDRRVRAKAYAHLISKGFDHDAAHAALEAISDED